MSSSHSIYIRGVVAFCYFESSIAISFMSRFGDPKNLPQYQSKNNDSPKMKIGIKIILYFPWLLKLILDLALSLSTFGYNIS